MALSAAVPFEQIDCLESALSLLEDVNHNFKIQQEDYNSVKTSLRELVSVHFNLNFISIHYLVISWLNIVSYNNPSVDAMR